MTGVHHRPTRSAPDFVLPDHRGEDFHLRTRLTDGAVVLVFYRGHWCFYCRRHLRKLAMRYREFTERGVTLAAISPEPAQLSHSLATQLEIEFPLLCDTTGRVIDAYGVRNAFSYVRAMLPHPAVFVIAPDQTICFQSIDRNYKKRATVRSVLGALDELASTQRGS